METFFVGVDAHRTVTQLAVIDSAGKLVHQARVASTRAAVGEALRGIKGTKHAVVEASYNWGVMYDCLSEICEEVVLAHPARVRAIADAKIKTDSIDAITLAQLLRMDYIPEAYAPTAEIRARKRVLRQRLYLVCMRTQVKNRIKALVAQHPLEQPKVRDLFGKGGMAWLNELCLPEPDQGLLAENLVLLAVFNERIAATDSVIADLAAGDPAVAWLKSLPGIGPFFSVLIRYEVDNITRFPSAKKFASYTGLVPSTYASAARITHGRLTKQGNKWLRWALVEAVQPAIRCSPSLRCFYERLRRRRGVKEARVATARKLAELIWTIWTEQRLFAELR